MISVRAEIAQVFEAAAFSRGKKLYKIKLPHTWPKRNSIKNSEKVTIQEWCRQTTKSAPSQGDLGKLQSLSPPLPPLTKIGKALR